MIPDLDGTFGSLLYAVKIFSTWFFNYRGIIESSNYSITEDEYQNLNQFRVRIN